MMTPVSSSTDQSALRAVVKPRIEELRSTRTIVSAQTDESKKPPVLGVGFGKESVSQPAAAVTALKRGLNTARQAMTLELGGTRDDDGAERRERIMAAQKRAAQSGEEFIASLNKAAGGAEQQEPAATLRVGTQTYSFTAGDTVSRLDLRA